MHSFTIVCQVNGAFCAVGICISEHVGRLVQVIGTSADVHKLARVVDHEEGQFKCPELGGLPIRGVL